MIFERGRDLEGVGFFGGLMVQLTNYLIKMY